MVKKLVALLVTLTFSLMSFAIEQNDIIMVSYEQGWLDREGTLALKNNTQEQIHNISFQIIYIDMSGNELDYSIFTKDVEIAPGMTKKLDIPAYEHERNYHYYCSENRPSGSPAFKIRFELMDYNTSMSFESEDAESDYTSTSTSQADWNHEEDTSVGDILMIIAFLMLFMGFLVGMYVLVAVMAKNRNRNVAIWILLSIVSTPILMVIILLLIGDENKTQNEEYSKIN